MSDPIRFLRRRRRLRRAHLCTRCGTEPNRPGRSLCRSCCIIAAFKRAPLPADAIRKAQETKRARLLGRLDLIDQARRAVQEELDRIM